MGAQNDFRRFSRQRLRTSCYKDSILSITSLHTETINIWSHLLGAIWFGGSAVHVAITCTGPPTHDVAVVLVYLVATALCFTSSTLYHLFSNHISESLWLCVDHLGIICAIWASSVSFVSFSFDCRLSERRAYMTLITVAAVLCLARLWEVRPHDAQSRRSRLCTHVVLGGVAVLPVLHYRNLPILERQSDLGTDFLGLVATTSVGTGIYATHILDKTIGMDLGLPDASHHVMHVVVAAGAWIFQQGLLLEYQKRKTRAPVQCI